MFRNDAVDWKHLDEYRLAKDIVDSFKRHSRTRTKDDDRLQSVVHTQ